MSLFSTLFHASDFSSAATLTDVQRLAEDVRYICGLSHGAERLSTQHYCHRRRVPD
jgi:hypothetical protein